MSNQWAEDLQAWSLKLRGEELTTEQIKALQYAGIRPGDNMSVIEEFTGMFQSHLGAPKDWYDNMPASSRAEQIGYEIADNVLITLVAHRMGPVDSRRHLRSYEWFADNANNEEQATFHAVRRQVEQRFAENPDATRQEVESAVWNGILS